ncbi:hypothetical protein BGZ49_002525 [Haplosporangium sp. Z 27]|nr:hypothetical protein BGZ49_002525 [Haplosporangium sp. Z 27]
MEEWYERVENINGTEKDFVIDIQYQKFKTFVKNKISPFNANSELSPPYTPSHLPRMRLREDFTGASESSWEVLAQGDIIDALEEMRPH